MKKVIYTIAVFFIAVSVSVHGNETDSIENEMLDRPDSIALDMKDFKAMAQCVGIFKAFEEVAEGKNRFYVSHTMHNHGILARQQAESILGKQQIVTEYINYFALHTYEETMIHHKLGQSEIIHNKLDECLVLLGHLF